MSYVKFILKKIRKSRLNIIPFILAAIFLMFMYYCYQYKTMENLTDPKFSGEEQIEQTKKSIESYQDTLKFTDETTEYHQNTKERLALAENELRYLEQKLEAVKNEDWKEYYKSELELTKISLDFYKVDKTFDYTEHIELQNINQKFYQYMIDHYSGFDERFSNIMGMTFMAKALNYYAPVILAILLIYIVSSMYCSTYLDNMDLQKLLPMSPIARQKSRMVAGGIAGGFIILFIAGISFICGTVINAMGNLSSPVLTYTLQGADSYVSILSVLPQFLLLVSFAIFFIVNFISVISLFARKHITCMLISLVIIVGCLVSATNIAQLQPYLHLLPTSYLNSFQIISGEFAFLTGNANADLLHGILVLGLSNAILILLYYYIPILKNRVKMKESNV